jgi:hypothetical protein
MQLSTQLTTPVAHAHSASSPGTPARRRADGPGWSWFATTAGLEGEGIGVAASYAADHKIPASRVIPTASVSSVYSKKLPRGTCLPNQM